ncbi:MAG: hypothetical protein UV64_C0007G0050 [Parcubacteria group bacterium GW2011_GWC1_43_11b]|nr:MAG: hypothetical protein UV64_C0007G0050 [Parcubacteria group bacterium GW2011_GWC1_43_11b]
MRKILKIEEPGKEDRRYRGGMYRVWFEGLDFPAYMLGDHYAIMMLERMLLLQVPEEKRDDAEKLLDRLLQAKYEVDQTEFYENQADSSEAQEN